MVELERWDDGRRRTCLVEGGSAEEKSRGRTSDGQGVGRSSVKVKVKVNLERTRRHKRWVSRSRLR